MIRSLTLAVVLGALALPAVAQNATVTEAQITALTTAIADAGCEVSESNNAAILAAAGLDATQAAAAVAALLGDGRAVLEGGSLRLKTDPCE
jgi:hypothetical protein